jgi:MFS family permease
MGSIIVIIGVGLQSGAINVEMFIGARFLIGFGSSISGNAAPTLIVELSHPKQRGTVTGVSSSLQFLLVMRMYVHGTHCFDI